ncbi:MAG: hypothetical protein ACR2FY_25770 [Pirellulaceae bacterium]
MNRSWRFVALIGVAFLLGCGGYKAPSGVVVKGKVTKGGAPITVPNMDSGTGTVKIELFPVHADAQDSRDSVGTTSKSDGSFEITGAGKGVTPGKYKLAIFADPGDGVNQLGDKFTGSDSPIEVEVADKNLGGTQDLGSLEVDSFK